MKSARVSERDQDQLLGALESEFTQAKITSAELAMLAYAAKLTVQPSSISTADIEILHREGFDDRAIHDICTITAYFAFVNRIADGLGVALETDAK